MSLSVVVQETALRALARIRSEDREAFASIRQALAALADQPRPDEAVAWGGSGIYRRHLPAPGSCMRSPKARQGFGWPWRMSRPAPTDPSAPATRAPQNPAVLAPESRNLRTDLLCVVTALMRAVTTHNDCALGRGFHRCHR